METEKCGIQEAEVSDGLCMFVQRRFQSTFKEIFNIVDLALDERKAEIAKSSIGNSLEETKKDIRRQIYNYFHEDSVK